MSITHRDSVLSWTLSYSHIYCKEGMELELISAFWCFLLLLLPPGESTRGSMGKEDRNLACSRVGNDRSSWGGVQLEVEGGFGLVAAADLRQRLGKSWMDPLWAHELCSQLEESLGMNWVSTDLGWGSGLCRFVQAPRNKVMAGSGIGVGLSPCLTAVGSSAWIFTKASWDLSWNLAAWLLWLRIRLHSIGWEFQSHAARCPLTCKRAKLFLPIGPHPFLGSHFSMLWRQSRMFGSHIPGEHGPTGMPRYGGRGQLQRPRASSWFHLYLPL